MASLAIPLAISGISALAGLFGNRKKTTEQKSTSTEHSDSSNMPVYDASTEIMKKLLMDRFLGRTEDTGDYLSGYAHNGLQNINSAYNTGQNNIESILAARGLGRTSAGASSLVQNQINRANQSANFLNTLPQMADERYRNSLSDAANFFKAIPVGQHTVGDSTRNTTGTATDPGNMVGGTFASLGSTLAGLYGSGAFGGPPARRPFYR